MPRPSPLPAALKRARRARGLSQEAFSDVSGRTYLSALERGIKTPTLSKIAALCRVLGIHPLTLLTLSYTGGTPHKVNALMSRVRRELQSLKQAPKR